MFRFYVVLHDDDDKRWHYARLQVKTDTTCMEFEPYNLPSDFDPKSKVRMSVNGNDDKLSCQVKKTDDSFVTVMQQLKLFAFHERKWRQSLQSFDSSLCPFILHRDNDCFCRDRKSHDTHVEETQKKFNALYQEWITTCKPLFTILDE